MTGLLLIMLLLGVSVLAARSLFALSNPLEFVPVGLTGGLVLYLMLVNLSLRAGLTLQSSLVGSLVVQGLAGLLVAFRRQGPRWVLPLYSPAVWAYYLGATALVYFATVSQMFLLPEDDFWLHTPLQAQLLQGNFPIQNPVFSQLPYGGHYARDLGAVVLAWWSGLDLYAVQAPLITFLQVTSFWLVFASGARFGGSPAAAVFCSLFLFNGINAAGRCGWLDTVSNNNPLAQAHTALVVFLLLKVLFEATTPGQVVAASALFAGLAWTYESSFLSLALALLFLAAVVMVKGRLSRRQIKISAAVVLVSLGMMLLQGGVLGEFLLRAVSPPPTSSVDELLQAQNLEVALRFPKEKLFQIKLARAGDEVSIAYHTFSWTPRFKPQEPGYVSVFSPLVFRIHWLSLYLAPLALVTLWRRGNPLGLLFWGYGICSYMIPALVDFGIFEVEVYRWEYAASAGFAAALGVAVGQWISDLRGRLLKVEGSDLILSPRWTVLVGVLLLTYLNLYPGWVQLQKRTQSLPSISRGWLFSSSADWLAYHPMFDLDREDLELAERVAPHVRPGDRILMPNPGESAADLIREVALVGLLGTPIAGHAYPLRCERLGTKPFRRDNPAIAFWASLDPDLLRNWPLRWLYRRESQGQLPLVGDEIEEFARDGERVYYRVSSTPFVSPPQPATPHPSLQLEKVDGLEGLSTEEYRPLTLSLKGTLPAGEQVLSYRFVETASGRPLAHEEGLSQTLRRRPDGTAVIHFVSPHNPDQVKAQFFLNGYELGEFDVVPTQLEAVQHLTVRWQENDPLVADSVQSAPLVLHNPTSHTLRLKGVYTLHCTPPDIPAPPDLQEFTLTIAPHSSQTLPAKVATPQASGVWPFQLNLYPKDSHLTINLPPRAVLLEPGTP